MVQVDNSYFLRSIVSRVLESSFDMIVSFTVKSLKNTYHFLREVVPSESQIPANVKSQDHSAFAIQDRIAKGRGPGSDLKVKAVREVVVMVVREDEEER